jgi:uncharacterized delta-60 repeat protein
MPWLFRLESDGSVDTSFTAPTTSFDAVQKLLANGQLIVSTFGAVSSLYRLNADGSLDASFAPFQAQRAGLLHELPTGQLLVTAAQDNAGKLYRLNSDGSLDPTFNIGTATYFHQFSSVGVIGPVLPLEDGKMIVTGIFRTYNGETRNSIVRLHPDGSVDTSFLTGQGFVGVPGNSTDPGQLSSDGPRRLPGGQLLVRGLYERFDGQRVTPPIVLNADGTRDPSFEGTVSDVFGYLDSLNFIGPNVDLPDLWILNGYGLGRIQLNMPVRIVSTTRDPDGLTQLLSNALPGRNYTLQSSDDLLDWNDLVTQAASTNRVEFEDPPNAQPARRFYRVKQD